MVSRVAVMALFALAGDGLAADWAWHETLSPHFQASHEMPWMPPGFVLNLERMHNKLRRDLSMFSPGMAKERLKVYLYKDQASYLAGEFKPPSWSNGVAIFEKKAVAVMDMEDRRKLLEVISHETTHLLFQGYWQENGKTPPAWLNEGLAMLEEAETPEHPERGDWYGAMAFQDPATFLPMEDFLKITPTKDLHNKDSVGIWYIQAYSVVHFLLRTHSRLQFKGFCGRLRDGKELKESLWLVYRYSNVEKFEDAWRAWLAKPEHRKKVAAVQAMARAAPSSKKDKPEKGSAFAPMKSFKSLRE